MENNFNENDTKNVKLDEAVLDGVSGGCNGGEHYCYPNIYCASCGSRCINTVFVSQAQTIVASKNRMGEKCPDCGAVNWAYSEHS